jgi:hypothetical protein
MLIKLAVSSTLITSFSPTPIPQQHNLVDLLHSTLLVVVIAIEGREVIHVIFSVIGIVFIDRQSKLDEAVDA